MRRLIPAPLISVCADITSTRETHASLDSLFMYAGVPGDPPAGSKHVKALEWLRTMNKDKSVDPLDVVGRLIESYMEVRGKELLPWEKADDVEEDPDRKRILQTLAQCKLQYVTGGKIVGSLAAPSRTLEEFIKERDSSSIDIEFNRALANVDSNPREAVSAASNILESICKVYIDEEGLEMPAKQDLKPVWTVVRKHLGFDPSTVEDQDLQQILSGLISIVEGVGALRTHASSAHGAGKRAYKLEPRHARLTIHGAHTVALFILESWKKRKSAR